jgi:hypothetical protein|nr:hypothetical protein [Bacillaceae bacterium]
MNFPCPLPGRHRKGCYQGEGKGGSFQTISAGGRDAHVPTEGGKRVQFRGAEEMPKNGDIPKRNAGEWSSARQWPPEIKGFRDSFPTADPPESEPGRRCRTPDALARDGFVPFFIIQISV